MPAVCLIQHKIAAHGIRDNVVAERELSQFSVRSQTIARAKNHHMRKSESVDRNKIKLLIARKKRSGTKIEKANYNLM